MELNEQLNGGYISIMKNDLVALKLFLTYKFTPDETEKIDQHS